VPEDGTESKLPKAKKAKISKESQPAQATKKSRKKKDKDAPKKALSAFMFFSNDVRDKVKAENPGIAFGEVGKKIGEMWKTLSAEDKAPYDAQADEDKKRYAEDMEAYRAKKKADGGEDDGEGGAVETGDAIIDD